MLIISTFGPPRGSSPSSRPSRVRSSGGRAEASRRARVARSMPARSSNPGAGLAQRRSGRPPGQSVSSTAARLDKLPGPGACTRLARMLVLLTLLAGAALADAPPPSPPPLPPEAQPAPHSSGDRRQGPFTRDTYPSEVSARPLTLPAGMFRAGAALDVDYIRLTTYSWSTGLGISGSYGLIDRIELGAAASFGLSPLLEVDRVGASATMLLIDGTTADLAVALGLDVTPFSISLSPGISLGFPGRLLLTDQLFVTFGAELLRVQPAPLLAQGALKLGVGGQVSSSVAVIVETDLLKLAGQALL